jgi:chromosome segregation ATPase
MESRGRGERSNLLSKVVDLRAGVNEVRREAQEIRGELVYKQAEHAAQQMEAANDLSNKVDTLNESISRNTSQLNSISSATSSIQTSVVSLRNLGGRFVQFINTFPAEIRELLQRILRTNLQIYYMLLFSQTDIGRSPSLLLQSNIRFEDALGRVRELPYEWFRHWEV